MSLSPARVRWHMVWQGREPIPASVGGIHSTFLFFFYFALVFCLFSKEAIASPFLYKLGRSPLQQVRRWQAVYSAVPLREAGRAMARSSRGSGARF